MKLVFSDMYKFYKATRKRNVKNRAIKDKIMKMS